MIMQPETATMSGKLLSRPCTWGALCVLVLTACIVDSARSADPPVISAPQIKTSPSDASVALPVAADRFGWFWTFLETTLHSRGRMVQFGVIGMCIALYF